MSAKAISEQTGKEFLYKYICTSSAIQNRFKYARVTPDTDWARLTQDHPWLLSEVRTALCLPLKALLAVLLLSCCGTALQLAPEGLVGAAAPQHLRATLMKKQGRSFTFWAA